MNHRLSILMAGLEHRPWRLLAEQIQAQAAAVGGVEFLSSIDAGQRTSGAKRQELLEQSRGDYVMFIDDDDRVAEDFVAAIAHACQSFADVIAFDLEMYFDGVRRETWKFGLWPDDRRAGRMSINHLCAWKRSIATRVAWCPDLGYGDDQLWYKPLLASGYVRSCHRIERTLYHYLYSAAGTSNQRPDRVLFSKRYSAGGLNCWRDDAGEIYIDVGEQTQLPRWIEHDATMKVTQVASSSGLVRDRSNRVLRVSDVPRARKFCKVSIA